VRGFKIAIDSSSWPTSPDGPEAALECGRHEWLDPGEMNERNDAILHVLDRFRRLCLRLPETSETDSWGHPNFRAGKRTFATFEWIENRPSIAIHLDPDAIDRFLRDHPDSFASPYGRGKWVSIWADGKLDWDLVEDLIVRSYRRVALKRMLAALEEPKSRSDGSA
jgi:predicted DNA-binding protein (MmcQ/YjbR family)